MKEQYNSFLLLGSRKTQHVQVLFPKWNIRFLKRIIKRKYMRGGQGAGMKKQAVLKEINAYPAGKVYTGEYVCRSFYDPPGSFIHEGSKISDLAFTSFCFTRVIH